jgi:hypothetical protein
MVYASTQFLDPGSIIQALAPLQCAMYVFEKPAAMITLPVGSTLETRLGDSIASSASRTMLGR